MRQMRETGALLVLAFTAVILLSQPTVAADLASTATPTVAGEEELLQFTSSGHVFGFRSKEMYIASADHALKIEFAGARAVAPATQEIPSSSPGEFKRAAPLNVVTYPDLWDGVTLVYEHCSGAVAKSTYHIAPDRSSAVDQIRLRYNVPVQVDSSGNLLLMFETGQMHESAPVAYQEISGHRIPVKAAFCLLGEHEVGFSIGTFDPSFPLVIDPTLTWNTFMGSAGEWDYSEAIAVDGSGNVYVAGYSHATWGTPVNAYTGSVEAFAAKLSSNGSLTWNTFMGSAFMGDESRAIAVDASGNVYVAGYSDATWGTPVNPHAGGRGSDAFAAKLSSNGSLTWNTFMGSGGMMGAADYGEAIAVDSSGNVYVAGYSGATWGTPVDPHSEVGSYDAFAAKLSSNGNLTWNTFMGSAGGDDYGETIAVDGSGNVYVAGYSPATWGTPVNPHSGGGIRDAFAAKLASNGNLSWNTFMGSAGGEDHGCAIAVDSSGNVYVAGRSNATWGTPVNPFTGGLSAFVVRLSSNGSRTWNTFMGSYNDYGAAIAVDGSGNVYVAGYSGGTWGTPVNPHWGGDQFDAFAVKLSSNGSRTWNTFMGSATQDYCKAIAVDSSGNVYVTGYSFATWGTPVNPHSGGDRSDGFVAKLNQYNTLTPTLETEDFDDPNIGDTHLKTQWQISTQPDFSSLVLDVTSTSHLTSLTVDELVLEASTGYYWRFRFYDNDEEESAWSEASFFTTGIDPTDESGEVVGIPDEYEVGADEDLDDDGVPDNQQADIKSLISVDPGKRIGLKHSLIKSITPIDPDEGIYNTSDKPKEMPYGLITFVLEVDNPGDEAYVEVYLSEAAPAGMIWWKFDKTKGGWYDYVDYYSDEGLDDLVTFSDDRKKVTLRLKDGGYGDADGVANGRIVDPSGPGSPAGGGDDSGGGGHSDDSGCFIATAAFGSPMERHVTILKNFRDTCLLPCALGRTFVRTYYKYSPPLAHFISKHETLKVAVRISLLPLVAVSYGALHFGPTVTLTMLAVLLTLAIFLVLCYRRKAPTRSF